jgi:hypothetical protein
MPLQWRLLRFLLDEKAVILLNLPRHSKMPVCRQKSCGGLALPDWL